jgi:putative flippase GtrA
MPKKILDFVLEILSRHKILRYIISGGTSASVNIALFSFFFFVFNLHYILSNIISFSVAFFVSLFLQKFWTFRDVSLDGIHVQGFYYLLNSLLGLGLNTTILFVSVDYFGVLPIIGVIIAGGLTALVTFQISSRYVFNNGKI